MDSITAEEYLDNQLQLEKEARELMPYDPKVCTYSLGPIRQHIYACLTCSRQNGHPVGVCYACSIQCHTSHDLVELFAKRSFTCDCGTKRTEKYGVCSLRTTIGKKTTINKDQLPTDIPSSTNVYNHNYEGTFCACRKRYDPTDDSNMFQCAFGDACGEDWFHEECIMGMRPGDVNRRQIKGEGENKLESLSEPGLDAQEDQKHRELLEILPLPGFPDLDDFDTIICWKCVQKYRKEMEMLVKELECETITRNVKPEPEQAKRAKTEPSFTIFLKDNFKEQLQKVITENKPETKPLISLLKVHTYLYLEDSIYKPPEDEDDDSSIFELGLRNLSKLPVESAISSVHAYEKVKSKLTEFLRPFAEQNKVVTEEEIRSFFNGIE
ncbi:hypothetical protein KL918_004228 [Ogataea parapolymorpha]|uniref:Protein mlo2 n=1 Tax=Ogataea parapolymorpha (strain ATCC 26012 / BCRC 20466 / JCM 22074 / NRRL Y-7560 / DL-1) TaxID=871575 RepID=W1QH83_OGAPD|nr:Protein mlo2 [Ogataea parapolymorpha DL-1]ESX01407.1 Protein mlo2 [Ogataea parapolymorpha DL-1]KAG7865749.1 hypothetical protein KL918_004228 [Ogataea parapolymorpha]KAG7872132.1 hypothetical protein KL916_003470 [Ogataea parapolymorpha]